MVKLHKKVKKMIATILAAFLVITQVPASMNRVEAANEEYPEYLTVGFAQSNPGIKLDVHYDYQIGENGNPCAGNEMYNDPTKHYIIFEYTTDTSAIAYVRCDVFKGQTTPPDPDVTTFLVTYKNKEGRVLGKEFVNAGKNPKAENMPSVGPNGYWTLEGLEGQENAITPTGVTISSNTTFVWHEIKEPVTLKYTVSYWDGNKPFDFGENIPSTDEFTVGKKYIVKGFDGQHDSSEKHYFIGWVTEEGKKKFLNGEGNQIVNSSVKLNEIKKSEEFRSPQNSEGYDGLNEPGEIKLYAVWANDKAVQGLYDLTINYISDDDEPKILAESFTTSLKVGEEYSKTSPDIKGYALVNQNQKVISGKMDSKDLVIDVVYSLDENKDNIPDKYQVKVTFKSENGTIKSGKDTVYVTLYDEEGKWNEKGKGYLTQEQIDEARATPNDGYNIESITWKDDKVPTTDEAITEDTEFTSIFAKGKYPVRIEFYFDGKTNEKVPNETSVEEFGSRFTGAFEKTLEVDGKTYALDKVKNNGFSVSTNSEKNVVKVYYSLDENKDNVPDKYQVKVTFKSENGTIKLGKDTVYVTLYDEEGKWNEKGKGYLTQEQIDEARATPNDGYNIESITWKDGKVPTTDEAITEDTEFTSIFVKGKYPVRIEFYFDGKTNEKVPNETSVEEFGSRFTGAFEKTLEVDGKTYALDKVKNNGFNVSTNSEKNVVKVYYSLDENKDNIPDKYQVEVKFEAINGTVSLDKVYVTLVDEEGKYAEDGKGFLTEKQIAVATANAGYDQDSLVWTPKTPTKEVEITEAITFTATFTEASYNLTINYVDEEGNKVANPKISNVAFKDQYSVESPAVEGYTLLDPKQATIEGTMGTSDITINVVYAIDEKGTDPENPDKGDNIPDKYQVEVKFEAINGTVSLDKTYVTLVDEEGKYAEDGKGFLTEKQIAVATANAGYDQDSLVWTPKTPTKEVEITEAMTFVATFEEVEEPVVPVDPTDPPVDPTDPEVPVTPEDPDITVTPDPETPVQPTTPEVTTPTDNTPNVVNPVDNTPAQVEDEPVVDVVEDEDTPLANLPEENVDDNQTPLAGLNGGWALVNLICTVVTVLFGLFLLISKKKKEEDKENDAKQMNVNMDEEEIRKRGLFTRILSVVVAIASVVVFFLTEDLTLKMVMTDKWTLLMVVFVLVQVVIFFVGRKWKAPKGNKPQQQTAMQ